MLVPRTAGLASALTALALALGGCGSAAKLSPVSHSALEEMLVNPFPVYWVGGSFHDLTISETFHDTSGAYSIQYGGCLEGGQGTCVAPLRIVTSADNSFVPGGGVAHQLLNIRGVQASLSQRQRTIVIPTGAVVVSIYARDGSLARAAANTIVPINEPGAPESELPAAEVDSDYAETPLPTQEPTPLHPLH
jgi:hypothetical protein